MAQTLGFTGYAGSGKDTAAQGLIDIGWKRRAFADPLRTGLIGCDPWIDVGFGKFERLSSVIERLGWDVAKRTHPEVRRLQQTYGTEGGRHVHGTDCWLKASRATLIPGVDYVYTDVRFPNEVEYIHQMGGCVVRIDRTGVEAVNSHVSDDIGGLFADFIIVNDGTVEELHAQLLKLVS